MLEVTWETLRDWHLLPQGLNLSVLYNCPSSLKPSDIGEKNLNNNLPRKSLKKNLPITFWIWFTCG